MRASDTNNTKWIKADWIKVPIVLGVFAAMFNPIGNAAEPPRFVSMPSDPWIPNFCHPDVVKGDVVRTARDGVWSASATWPGKFPEAEDTVVVEHHVILDRTAQVHNVCVQAGGRLDFAPHVPTSLRVVTLQIHRQGSLIIGTPDTPIEATAEIVFAGEPIDLSTDPGQYGTGLIVFGNITMHGRPLAKTFTRLAREPKQGDRVLLLAESVPTGWLPGDRLFIPDTRQHLALDRLQFRSQGEEVTVASVDGKQISLAEPLRHDHLGARDVSGRLDLLPHVSHLQRNIILRSEPGAHIRGHVLLAARARVDIRGVGFKALGRTLPTLDDDTQFDEQGKATKIGNNQKARYALHTHHLIGPKHSNNADFQFQLVNNVVEDALKWAVVIHGSHYGSIKGNIAYGFAGAGFVTEDGTESYNVFDGNMAVGIKAGELANYAISRQRGRGGVKVNMAASYKLFGDKPEAENIGFEGSGFWARLPHNIFRNNVAANVKFSGFNFNGYFRGTRAIIPAARGQSHHEMIKTRSLPLLGFENNEAYAAPHGIWTALYAGGRVKGAILMTSHINEAVFSDSRIWHTSHSAVLSYHNSKLTFRDMVIRGDVAISSGNREEMSRGFDFNAKPKYENGQIRLNRVDIQGMNIGIDLPASPEDGFLDQPNVTVINAAELANYVNIIEHPSMLHQMDLKTTIIKDVKFERIDMPAGDVLPDEPVDLWMQLHLVDYDRDGRVSRRIASPSKTYVINYNREVGNNFQVYFLEQDPGFKIPRDGCEAKVYDGLLSLLHRMELKNEWMSKRLWELTRVRARSKYSSSALPTSVVTPMEQRWQGEGEISNAECMRTEGRALAGAVAPCADQTCTNRLSYAEIVGLAFPVSTERYKELLENL